MKKDARIYIAGHRGLVGSAILRKLKESGFRNLILRTSQELDLRDQAKVNDFFSRERPDFIFLAAARVGGIYANSRCPADFIYDNLAIQTNVIHCAHIYGVKKLLFLGSACIYPKFAPQPLKEEHLLTGPLEPTNESYALAKIAGLKMCQAYNRQYGTNFLNIMPTNLYGPNDNYDLESSHVIPALIRKFHEAKMLNLSTVEVWGSGTARREFLFSEDLAEACLFLMENLQASEHDMVNVGVGEDITIRELAELIGDMIAFKGEIIFDRSKPDGMPRRLLDVSLLRRLGWRARTGLREGLSLTYQDFLLRQNCASQ